MKENSFTLKRARSKRYSAETITDTDNTDDLVLLVKTPAQAESLPEQAAKGIGLYLNSEFTRFNQEDAISLLNGKPLKLVDQLIYLGSNISSTESNINIRIGKALTVIDKLSAIWKSYFWDNNTRILPSFNCVSIIIRLHKLDSNETTGEKAIWELLTGVACCFERIPEATLRKTAAERPFTSHHTICSRRTKYGYHCQKSKDELTSDVLQWTPTHGHTNVGWPTKTLISSVLTWDAFKRTCQKQWPIGMESKSD